MRCPVGLLLESLSHRENTGREALNKGLSEGRLQIGTTRRTHVPSRTEILNKMRNRGKHATVRLK